MKLKFFKENSVPYKEMFNLACIVFCIYSSIAYRELHHAGKTRWHFSVILGGVQIYSFLLKEYHSARILNSPLFVQCTTREDGNSDGNDYMENV